jgi:hypothetical protein
MIPLKNRTTFYRADDYSNRFNPKYKTIINDIIHEKVIIFSYVLLTIDKTIIKGTILFHQLYNSNMPSVGYIPLTNQE